MMSPPLLWHQECKQCAIRIFGDSGETHLPLRSWEGPRSLNEPAPWSQCLAVSSGAPTCAAPGVTRSRTVFVRREAGVSLRSRESSDSRQAVASAASFGWLI